MFSISNTVSSRETLMSLHKSSQKTQPHDSSSRKNVFDSASPSSKSVTPSKSSSKTKKKAAWLDAPLPQFYDQELAAEMVKLGYYSSIEEAYLEVPESRLNSVHEKTEEYLLNSHPPIFWRNAPLPSPKK
jgi:hypothetical protein